MRSRAQQTSRSHAFPAASISYQATVSLRTQLHRSHREPKSLFRAPGRAGSSRAPLFAGFYKPGLSFLFFRAPGRAKGLQGSTFPFEPIKAHEPRHEPGQSVYLGVLRRQLRSEWRSSSRGSLTLPRRLFGLCWAASPFAALPVNAFVWPAAPVGLSKHPGAGEQQVGPLSPL